MQPDLQTVYASGSKDVAAQQNTVLRNTYLLLAVSLIPTVIGAAVGTNFVNFSFMRSSPIMSMIVMLAVFYGWIFMIEKNRNSVLGVGLLLGFTAFMGLMLAPLLQSILSLRNGGQLVMMAAGGTASAETAVLRASMSLNGTHVTACRTDAGTPAASLHQSSHPK